MTALTLPPEPRAVPGPQGDPAAVRSFAADLLAASAQVDDVGTFAAGAARPRRWQGAAATAYDAALRPLGRRADAMSLALRHLARRGDQHAGDLTTLEDRRVGLLGDRADLLATIEALRDRATAGADAAALQAACEDCARRVRAFEGELDRWTTDLVAAEEAMCEELERVLALDQVQVRHADTADPADRALAAQPRPGASPAAAKAWWDGLTRDEQLAVVAAAPGAVGNRDGVPAWARDAANGVALARDLADLGHLEAHGLLTARQASALANARAAKRAVAEIEESHDPVTGARLPATIHRYDPTAFAGDGAVAVAAGDLGSAEHVAVTVPGFGTDGESAVYHAERILDLYEASRSVDDPGTVATMFWIGYDAPDDALDLEGGDAVGVVGEAMATAGGALLAGMLDGLREARDGSDAHLTVIGHSYGSTTAGHAAHDHGIPVDDLVLVGSPGAGGETDHARDTRVAEGHVWVGANSRDPVAGLGNHGWFHLESALGGAGLGDDPAEDDFGAIRFRAESTTRHGDHADALAMADHGTYFDHGTESLFNISRVVTGNYDDVDVADHLTDPWWGEPRDPEWDRVPAAQDTRDHG